MPAGVRPRDILGIKGEANRITLTPVGRNAGGPKSLEGVGGYNEGDDTEGDLVELCERTPGLTLHFSQERVNARSQEASQAKKHHHAPENNFGPHLSVNAKDIQTESLANVTHGVIAQVTEARI